MDKQEIEDEFYRITEILRQQGDIDCIIDLISLEDKKHFIDDWKRQD